MTINGWDNIVNYNLNIKESDRNIITIDQNEFIDGDVYDGDGFTQAAAQQLSASNVAYSFIYGLREQLIYMEGVMDDEYDMTPEQVFDSATLVIDNLQCQNGEISFDEMSITLVFNEMVRIAQGYSESIVLKFTAPEKIKLDLVSFDQNGLEIFTWMEFYGEDMVTIENN